MPDDQGSSNRSEEDSRSGLWTGLKTMLFGGASEPSLREQIEDVIDEAEEEGDVRRGSSAVGDLSSIERKMLRFRAAKSSPSPKVPASLNWSRSLPRRVTAACRSIAKRSMK
jgi:hypothetical protein